MLLERRASINSAARASPFTPRCVQRPDIQDILKWTRTTYAQISSHSESANACVHVHICKCGHARHTHTGTHKPEHTHTRKYALYLFLPSVPLKRIFFLPSCLHTTHLFHAYTRLFLVSRDFLLIFFPPSIHRSLVNSLPTLAFPRTKSRFFLQCNRGSGVWGGGGKSELDPPQYLLYLHSC